ncbi:MAG: hypothetical protein HRU20_11380 [Pseudomonadales bacterium]|nr:hypothetical protein [Pseudomonadales bacterium]
MKNFNVKCLTFCSSLILLTACNAVDDTDKEDVEDIINEVIDGNATSSERTLSGTAIDGYLKSALACLDLNSNKLCDSGEPTAITDENGDFDLDVTGIDEETLKRASIVVKIIAGQTVDSDKPDEVVDAAYTLTAPPGYTHITPLSTMVESERLANGGDLDAAEEQIKASLGTLADLDVDYIEAQDAASDDGSMQKQLNYDELRAIAQVLARIIAENLEQTLEASEANGEIDFDDVMTVVAEDIKNALDDIRDEVEKAMKALPEGETFDVDDAELLAHDEELWHQVKTDAETLEERIAIHEALKAQKLNTNLATLLKEEGRINWFWGQLEEVYGEIKAELEYGHIAYNNETDSLSESRYYYDVENGFMPSEEADLNEEIQLVLTADGWREFHDNREIAHINEDGSLTLLAPGFEDFSETVHGEALDVSGLNIRSFLDGSGEMCTLVDVINPEADFSETAQAYHLSFKMNQDVYQLSDWNCSDDENSEIVEGMCNFVHNQNGDGNADSNGPALTLSALISSEPADVSNPESIKGPHVAWGHKGLNIVAEMLEDGSVNYYGIQWDQEMHDLYQEEKQDLDDKPFHTELIAQGRWEENTVFNKVMILMPLPFIVKEIASDEEDIVMFTEYQGAVRRGSFLPAGHTEGMSWAFNNTAADDIASNINLDLLSEFIYYPEQHIDGTATTDDEDKPQLEQATDEP